MTESEPLFAEDQLSLLGLQAELGESRRLGRRKLTTQERRMTQLADSALSDPETVLGCL